MVLLLLRRTVKDIVVVACLITVIIDTILSAGHIQIGVAIDIVHFGGAILVTEVQHAVLPIHELAPTVGRTSQEVVERLVVLNQIGEDMLFVA